jgi:DNA topoisomerase VI subunit B
MDNLDLSRLLMEYLQKHARGRENAVNRDTVLDYLRLFDRGLHDLRAKAVPLLTRHKTVLTYYPHLAPAHGEQMELFG